MEKNSEEQAQNEYPSHWMESIIREIDERNLKEIYLSTGKTPSGHIHLGIMRELLICDAIRRIYQQRKKKVKFRLFFDSLDAAKRFPSYVSKEYANQNIGKPFALIPNPFPTQEKSYAEFFGLELASTFKDFGIEADLMWSHELYRQDDMKSMIRVGLKKNEFVKEIVAKYLTASMSDEQKLEYIEQQKNWMGAMVICEKCSCTQKKQNDGTISPNRVLEFDEKNDECHYICPACGYEGNVKISSGNVKLNWRLDWPAKWTLFHTTCEPAGKDHCTPGGSYDTGLDLCQNIYNYEGPIKVPYEWLRLGDKDMKTSKGIVFTPKRFLEIADPQILRMLIYQTNLNKHLSIRIEELEQYYNEFYRIEKIFYGLDNTATENESREIKYIYPLIIIGNVSSTYPIRIPFKFLTVLAQLNPILGTEKTYQKAIDYLRKEYDNIQYSKETFDFELNRAKNWIEEMEILISEEKDPSTLKKLNQKIEIFKIVDIMTDNIKNSLDEQQKRALSQFLLKAKEKNELNEDNVKEIMISIREEFGINPMKIFQGFYQIFLNSKKGPRLGPLMAILEKKWIEERIYQAIN